MKSLLISLEFWLARRSKFLDRYFTNRFQNRLKKIHRHIIENIDLDTSNIKIVKR